MALKDLMQMGSYGNPNFQYQSAVPNSSEFGLGNNFASTLGNAETIPALGGNLATPGAGSDWYTKLFGGKAADGTFSGGLAMPVVAGGSALLNGFLGMQQYGLAQKQFSEGKRQYDQNYQAQRTTTNAQLEDRQRARVASNSGAYQSVADYMKKNQVV